VCQGRAHAQATIVDAKERLLQVHAREPRANERGERVGNLDVDEVEESENLSARRDAHHADELSKGACVPEEKERDLGIIELDELGEVLTHLLNLITQRLVDEGVGAKGRAKHLEGVDDANVAIDVVSVVDVRVVVGDVGVDVVISIIGVDGGSVEGEEDRLA